MHTTVGLIHAPFSTNCSSIEAGGLLEAWHEALGPALDGAAINDHATLS